MKRREFTAALTPVTAPADFGGDVRGWLLQQAQQYGLCWLLAHADDGVNWGVVREGQLRLSTDEYGAYAPPLRAATLQQVRLFGPAGELYLWRGDGEWCGRYLAARAEDDTLTTHYLLWGDNVKGRTSGDFLLLSDGAEGLHHAPPLLPEATFDPKRQNLGVQVQHYVAYDDDGQAHIAASRLVALVVVDQKEGK